MPDSLFPVDRDKGRDIRGNNQADAVYSTYIGGLRLYSIFACWRFL